MNFHLTVAYWCVLVSAVFPYVFSYNANARAFGPRDNVTPRDWATKQSGWRARANAAQANSFEGLPFFIGAVIIAHQLGAQQGRIDALAVAYIVLRLLFIALYLRGANAARSAFWLLGFMVNIAIVFAGR